MSDIQGTNPTPSYKEEFQHSVDLFERSLHGYQQSQMDNQKTKFQEVMNEATHVMSETSPQFLDDSDQKQVKQLQKDFQAFMNNPSSDIMKKLQSDINTLKNV
jgi:molecular chaperone DnaK (HSP70)